MTGETPTIATRSRECVRATLDHRQPDQLPIDFGGTAVTGIHVSVVAALRDHYGLEQRPVKVHEPYQMLGLVEDDLKQALGVDVVGIGTTETMFGFRNDGWRPWMTPFGLEVLVSENFHTTVDERGDTLVYPKGNREAPASACRARGTSSTRSSASNPTTSVVWSRPTTPRNTAPSPTPNSTISKPNW
jgi:hypothetical protein